MKTLNTLFVAAAAAMALSGVSQAQPVSTTGQANTGPITVSGNIAKYVNFTKNHTNINMRDIGGPAYVGIFESGVISGVNLDNAEVIFDANTHISVNILNGEEFVSTKRGAHQDELLPTKFRIGVKGNSVQKDSVTGQVVATSNVAFQDQGLTPASTPSTPISSTYVFSHGYGNGIRVGAQAMRNGMDDHFGVYSTSETTITWLDLN